MAPSARIMLTVPARHGPLDAAGPPHAVIPTAPARPGTSRSPTTTAARGLPAPTFTNESFSPWFLILGLVSPSGRGWSSSCGSTAPPRRPAPSDSPTTHSPAWGVGSWFVPILNFWFPYQAHPRLPAPRGPQPGPVLQWWLAFQVAGVLGVAAFLSAFFSSGVAFGLSIPAAVLYVAVLATAPRVVAASPARTARRSGGSRAGPARRWRQLTLDWGLPGWAWRGRSPSKLFTLRLRSCCPAFTSPGYGPGSGRRGNNGES